MIQVTLLIAIGIHDDIVEVHDNDEFIDERTKNSIDEG
jgi:hypothetical protein